MTDEKSSAEINRIQILDDRFYTIDGEYFPSSTTILQSYPKGTALQKWIGDNGNFESNRIKTLAGEKGSIIHNAIEQLTEGAELDFRFYEEDEWKYLMAFCNFWQDYKPKTMEQEHIIVSRTHKYAGTMDWAGTVVCPAKKGAEPKEEFVRIDWKTSKNIWEEYKLQLVSYEMAEREAGKRPADRLMIVQLGTGTKRGYSICDFDKWDERFDMFLITKKMWEYTHPNAKPFEKTLPLKLSLK